MIVAALARFTERGLIEERRLYIVRFQATEKNLEDRAEAIALAKEWTSDSYDKAQVLGEDGREIMIYRDGGLEDYVYETRRRRPGGDDRPRNNDNASPAPAADQPAAAAPAAEQPAAAATDAS